MADISKAEFGGEAQEKSSERPTRVLAIDDYNSFLEGMAKALEVMGGLKVDSTTNPAKMSEIIKTAEKEGYPIGVIVCGLQMSGMNGFEVAKKVRSDGFRGHFILLTSAIQRPRMMNSNELKMTGVNEEMPKGGKVAELVKHIKAGKGK